jgi:hypothetical protein
MKYKNESTLVLSNEEASDLYALLIEARLALSKETEDGKRNRSAILQSWISDSALIDRALKLGSEIRRELEESHTPTWGEG